MIWSILTYHHENYTFETTSNLLIGHRVKKCMETTRTYSVIACITQNHLLVIIVSHPFKKILQKLINFGEPEWD